MCVSGLIRRQKAFFSKVVWLDEKRCVKRIFFYISPIDLPFAAFIFSVCRIFIIEIDVLSRPMSRSISRILNWNMYYMKPIQIFERLLSSKETNLLSIAEDKKMSIKSLFFYLNRYISFPLKIFSFKNNTQHW